jgi:hypothetical protein
VLGDELLRWTPAGYHERRRRPRGRCTLVTPPSLVAVLRRGWAGAVPLLHPSARASRASLATPRGQTGCSLPGP